MTPTEFGNQRRHETAPERERHVHPQQAGGLDPLRGGGSFGFVDFGQDALASFEVIAAGAGQRQTAGGAVKQLAPQPDLQRIDVLGRHRRRHAHMPRGGRKDAISRGTHEHTHAGDPVHAGKSSSINRRTGGLSALDSRFSQLGVGEHARAFLVERRWRTAHRHYHRWRHHPGEVRLRRPRPTHAVASLNWVRVR
ncbi:hypothetical protein OS176_10840 [Xanthomonadaceae bacterium XH05]|nr:hypothetical protein [Xanthomonadaceae bacterium XH05]